MHLQSYIKFLINNLVLRRPLSSHKVRSIFDIDFKKLQEEKIRLIIFDMDDTLCEFLGKPNKETQTLLQDLKKQDFKLAIFSNCSCERTKELNNIFENLRIYNVTRSDKPSPAGYKEIMRHFNISQEETLMVGDRIGTDIYGAYLAGIKYLFLVEPYSYIFGGKKAPIFIRIIRRIEKSLVNL